MAQAALELSQQQLVAVFRRWGEEIAANERHSVYAFVFEDISARDGEGACPWVLTEDERPFRAMVREGEEDPPGEPAAIRGIFGTRPKRLAEDDVVGLLSDLTRMIDAGIGINRVNLQMCRAAPPDDGWDLVLELRRINQYTIVGQPPLE